MVVKTRREKVELLEGYFKVFQKMSLEQYAGNHGIPCPTLHRWMGTYAFYKMQTELGYGNEKVGGDPLSALTKNIIHRIRNGRTCPRSALPPC